MKPRLELHSVHFQKLSVVFTPLKTLFFWAIFTTQLILRLKLRVMKKAINRVPTADTLVTVWEE
jgi:hypothetical protein